MCWGFDHGDGWFEIIWQLSLAIEEELGYSWPRERWFLLKKSFFRSWNRFIFVLSPIRQDKRKQEGSGTKEDPYRWVVKEEAPRDRLARYDSPALLADAIRVADPALLTVSLRRQLSGSKESGEAFWNLLRETKRTLLPNTAGCLTAHEAVKTACMGRELFQTNLVKLEVIGDELNLQPDPFGLVEAAMELVKLGFHVLPYCTEDWILCRHLMDAGCEALMPWAAPIGTGQGPRNPRALRELRQRAPQVPLIIDAGIGLPSHACQVMEWGFDGVLLNTAVSRSADPIRMARAFANAVSAGHSAFLAGPMGVQELAVSSTPEIGRPFATDRSARLATTN
jgi:thiazole synthase